MNQIDITIFRLLNSWVGQSPSIVREMIALRAWLLPWAVSIAFAALVLVPFIFRKYRAYAEKNIRIAICSVLSVGIARFMIVEIIRWFVERPRPFEALDGVTRLIPFVSDGSFPSGHAAAFFALATPIAFYYRKTALVFFFAAFVVSLDRILGGVHWPSDVLVGALVGIGTALVVSRFAQKRGFLD